MTIRLERSNWIAGLLVGFASLVTGLIAGVNPGFAVGGAFAIAFALVAFADLTAGLAVFILFAFIEPGSLGKVLIASTLVLALAWIGAQITSQSSAAYFPSRHRVAAYLLLVFIAWAAISASWAAVPSDAFLELARYSLNAALFMVAFTAMRTRERAGWVLGAFLLGASLLSSVAPLLQLESLGIGPEPGEREGRYTGGLADPNEFASLLIPAIALAFAALAAVRRAPLLRLGAVAALVICVISFYLTASRGGLVGLGVALLAALVFGGRWRPAVLLAALALVGSTIAYFGVLAPQEAKERISQVTTGEARVEQARVTIWQVGWAMAKDRPLAGVGAGNFENTSIRYVLEPGVAFRTDQVIDQPNAAHNTYLHLLDELGTPGAATFLAFAGFCVWAAAAAAWNFARAGDRGMEAIARGVLVGQVGMLAAGFFYSAQTVNKFWIVLAFGPALLALSRGQLAGRAGPPFGRAA